MAHDLEIIIEDVVLGTEGSLVSTEEGVSDVEVLTDTYIFNPSTLASSVEVIVEDYSYEVASASTSIDFYTNDLEVLASDTIISSGGLLSYSGTLNIISGSDLPIEVQVTDKVFNTQSAGCEVLIEDIAFDNVVIGETTEVAVYSGLAPASAEEVTFTNPGSGNVIDANSYTVQSALLNIEQNAASISDLNDYIAKAEDLLTYIDPAEARTNLDVYSTNSADALFCGKSANLSDLANLETARSNLSVYSKLESDTKYLVGASNLSDIPDKPAALANLGALSQDTADARYLRSTYNLSDLASFSAARTNLSVYSKAEIDTILENVETGGISILEGDGTSISYSPGVGYTISADILGLEDLTALGLPSFIHHNGTTSQLVTYNSTLQVSGGQLRVASAPKLSLPRTIQLTGYISSDPVAFDGSANITLNTSSSGSVPAHLHEISDVTGLQTALNAKAGLATATTSSNGLMSNSDKVKLDGVAAGANNYVHPTGDGHSHVPATGTTSNGKVLMSGAGANSASWQNVAISNVTGLQAALDGKANTSHTHTIANITGLQTALDNKAAFSHEHSIAQVAGLQTALDNKAAFSHEHSIAQVAGLQTALDAKAGLATATTSSNGLMSNSDKVKLDGVAAGANNYVHPTGDGHSHVPATGTTSNGKVLMSGAGANSASWQNVAISNVTGLQAALDGKANTSHTHTIANVTGLQAALEGKADTSHTHTIANVTGLQAELNNKAALSHEHSIAQVTGLQTALDGKASSTHTHSIANVTGLQTALDGKAAASHPHTIANVTGLQAALDGKASSTHSHAISDVIGLQTALDGKANSTHDHTFSSLQSKPTTLSGYGITDGVRKSGPSSATFNTTAGNWYRITTSGVDIVRNSGIFKVIWAVSGHHGSVRFSATTHYGQSAGTSIEQLEYGFYGTVGIVAARVVYHTSYPGNYAYLEVKFNSAITSMNVTVECLDPVGWILVTPSTAGSIPSGYTTYTHDFAALASIAAGTYKSVTIHKDGRVLAGTNPTTLAGYGITDSISKDSVGVVVPNGLNGGGPGAHVKSQVTGGVNVSWLTSRPASDSAHKAIGVNEGTGPVFWDGAATRKIWHEGNDGVGSGLDAGLLGGYSWTLFSRATTVFSGSVAAETGYNIARWSTGLYVVVTTSSVGTSTSLVYWNGVYGGTFLSTRDTGSLVIAVESGVVKNLTGVGGYYITSIVRFTFDT